MPIDTTNYTFNGHSHIIFPISDPTTSLSLDCIVLSDCLVPMWLVLGKRVDKCHNHIPYNLPASTTESVHFLGRMRGKEEVCVIVAVFC